MPEKITRETVRADFEDPIAVVHYTRAAHELGLWRSERIWIERYFPDLDDKLLEAGCGAGRVALGLWQLGYRNIVAFDFSAELIEQARFLAQERQAERIQFLNADATRLTEHPEAKSFPPDGFDGALFMFNGMMQIPGREQRRLALRQLARVCRAGARFVFTTHDRDASARDRDLWKMEAERWQRGEQDPRLVDFGDRYFEDVNGRTFMHLPSREEILEDLAATGWTHIHDRMRSEVARESHAVRDFSDECRFWVAAH